MKALVTGGGGFLGSAIVRMLRERGDGVRSFSRGNYPALRELGVEEVRGDIGNPEAIAAAVAGCDIVFHAAGKADIWGRWVDFHWANVIGTKRVIEACRKHGVRKLIFTSSPSVTFAGVDQNCVNESEPYPDKFLAYYPHTKALAEQAILAANGPELATVALRPHLIWGPGDPHLIPRLFARARAGKLRRIGQRPNLVDMTYIDNAAHAHLLAGDRLAVGSPIAGRAYYIAQDDPQPIWDFLNRVLSVVGIRPVTKSVSPTVAYFAAATIERTYRLFGNNREPPLTRFVVRQLSTAHWFDLSAVKRDLGYVPRVSIDEGLRKLAESLCVGADRTA